MTDFNVVKNFNLFVYKVSEKENSLAIRARMSARKMSNGEYPPTLWVDVIAPYETCDVDIDKPLEDWSGICISVDGNFAVDGYTRTNGDTVQTLKIFASRMSEVVFEKKEDKPASGDAKAKFKRKSAKK